MAYMICLSAAEAERACSKHCSASWEEHRDKRHGAGISRSGQYERLGSWIALLLKHFGYHLVQTTFRATVLLLFWNICPS